MPDVVRGILKIKFWEKKSHFVPPLLPPGYPGVSTKIFNQFGPVVWPSIAHVYMYEQRPLLYELAEVPGVVRVILKAL